MGKGIRNALVATSAAALIAVPAAPAAAQNDCIFAGWEYVVDDAVDCVNYVLVTLIDWPPR